MKQYDHSNTLFHLAADLINHTGRHLFLTGKAGTGKTTFLKYIKEQTQKATVVVAPTGVAAINAGGVTMHSFFQLPFGPFVPVAQKGFTGDSSATDRHSLFRNIHFGTAKRDLLKELELLIIDEVSMVRCDMLDAMDVILRHFRRQPELPFGGVQVMYIGDMFQLPPVIPQTEWNILKEHYDSPFFFSAKVIAEVPPLYIELKKIYRQNEQDFIDILNRVRNNEAAPIDLQRLNARYKPGFQPLAFEKYITLTTHNGKADIINNNELRSLPGKVFTYTAEITGDFSDKALPTDMNLQLKEGAQVMFIKNDSGAERRYYNGKIATVKKLAADEIIVALDDSTELKLEKEEWKNIRYQYNKESDQIDEEELGSFKQFPLRLAWAITIHKSQGLTFDKAIIDAGASFAAGQVYVALSRCTSLEGLVLHSRIYPSSIATDKRVIEFAQKEANDEYLETLLREEKQKFQAEGLVKTFNWTKLVAAVQEWKELVPAKKLPDLEGTIALSTALLEKAGAQAAVAEKFQAQLQQLLAQVAAGSDTDTLHQRVNKSILYFGKALTEDIILPLQDHLAALAHASKVKKYFAEVQTVEAIAQNHLSRLNAIQYGDLVFVQYAFVTAPRPVPPSKERGHKPVKGASQQETLALFRQGKTISEIAALRTLAISTVETHLASFIGTGEIEVTELVNPSKLESILKVIEKAGGENATAIKQSLSDEFTYNEIRAAMSHYRLQKI